MGRNPSSFNLSSHESEREEEAKTKAFIKSPKKEDRPVSAFFHTSFRELNSGYLTGTKATRTNRYGFGCTVNNCSYLTDIGLPSSVCLAVRMRNGLTENNAFTADTALCHNDTS